jgi:hypothetical protein
MFRSTAVETSLNESTEIFLHYIDHKRWMTHFVVKEYMSFEEYRVRWLMLTAISPEDFQDIPNE